MVPVQVENVKDGGVVAADKFLLSFFMVSVIVILSIQIH